MGQERHMGAAWVRESAWGCITGAAWVGESVWGWESVRVCKHRSGEHAEGMGAGEVHRDSLLFPSYPFPEDR